MQFSDYQTAAQRTDQEPLNRSNRMKALMIPLLGLAGEAGSLLTQYKRYLRDGEAYSIFRERVSEELGDILWNVANIASKTGLDLNTIAQKNLSKIQDRWHDQSDELFGPKLFDEDFPEHEQFPRQFAIEVRTESAKNRRRVHLVLGSQEFGDPLTDNSYEEDGYRFHDVFHLSFLAVLGWSPVLRGHLFFNCKRRSRPDVDEIQDGGRAAVIDEAIAALIFAEARKNSFFNGVDSVEYGLLRTIKDLTAHLEVSRCSGKQWERAILSGFEVWRKLSANKSGWIVGNLLSRTIEFKNANTKSTSSVQQVAT